VELKNCELRKRKNLGYFVVNGLEMCHNVEILSLEITIRGAPVSILGGAQSWAATALAVGLHRSGVVSKFSASLKGAFGRATCCATWVKYKITQ